MIVLPGDRVIISDSGEVRTVLEVQGSTVRLKDGTSMELDDVHKIYSPGAEIPNQDDK